VLIARYAVVSAQIAIYQFHTQWNSAADFVESWF